MESNKPSCPVCGGLEYFEDQGFYYCKDCQTQSQDIREEVHEYGFFNTTLPGKVSTVQKSSNLAQKRTNEEDVNEWTSWELYNFVLKGMVDELITLGASQEIKVVVLQLWTKYLGLLEIAFISKKNDLCMPKLSLPFHQRDARIVYENAKRTRRKKRKRKTRNEVGDNLSSSSPGTTVRKVKKAFLQAEYDKSFSEMETDTVSLLNESLKTSASEASSSSAKRISKKYFNRGVKKESLQKKKNRYSNNIYVKCQLTRKTLIAILYIALLILKEKIQLSDLIRWIEEGELSYYEVTHFFPDGQKLKDQDVSTFGVLNQRLTHCGVREFAKDMLIFLRIKSIKLPELLPLASRYIEELNLPAEILNIVEKVIRRAPPSLEWNPNSKGARAVPNTEGLVMGFIIVVLKLLMGLDGKTEYKQSEVAERVNRILEKTFPSVKLFVWNDWVKYIECRKSVLAAHHCPTHNAFFQQSSLENGTYKEFWNKMKTKDIKRKDRFILGADTKMNPSLVEAMKTVLEKLQPEDAISTPEFSSSLTPLKSNLEVVLTSELGTNQLSSKTLSILQQDFTETTLNYLLDPKMYVGLAHKHGINITVSEKSAQENVILEDRKFKYAIDSRRGRVIRITNRSENQSKVLKERNSSLLGDGCLDSDDSDDIYSLRESDEDDMFQKSTTFKTLPIVAENILLKYLDNNTNASSVEQKNKSGKKSKRNLHETQNEGKTYYTLYMPYSEYWVTEFSNLKISIKEFEENISSTFPPSFWWLLNQCSRVLHMTTQDLYNEVMNIENMHLMCSNT